MAGLSALQTNRLQVTVRNTFVDVDDGLLVRPVRCSSTPPSFYQPLAERGNIEIDTSSESPYSDADDGASTGQSTEGLEDLLIPDTDDEWEAPGAGLTSGILVGVPYSPALSLLVPPGVPGLCGAAALAPHHGGTRRPSPRPPPSRCLRCRGRMGTSCPCAWRADKEAGSLEPAALAPALPRSHAHAFAVKNVLVDAKEAPRPLAETTLKVSCAGGHEGIVVERMVQRSPLSGKAQEWLAARGAAGAAAAGRTKLSSGARAWQPGAADAAASPPATVPREESAVPPAPSPPQGAPRFGSALLRCVEELLRKSAFVAGVTTSAGAGSGWCVQIDVRSQHLYLKEHVLACAQEALFDVLDDMAALRARGPAAGRGIPETVFNLKVECLDPS